MVIFQHLKITKCYGVTVLRRYGDTVCTFKCRMAEYTQ